MPREAAEKVSDRSRGAPKAGQRLLGTHVRAKTHGTPTHSGSASPSPGVATDNEVSCDVADDILWGVLGDDGIAAFIGKSAAETYYLISIGALEGVKKLSHRTIVGSKRALRRQFIGGDAQVAPKS